MRTQLGPFLFDEHGYNLGPVTQGKYVAKSVTGSLQPVSTPRGDMIEREIKLQFETAGEARTAILAAGAAPLKCRRLQEDALFDTSDESLRRTGCALRVRSESGR